MGSDLDDFGSREVGPVMSARRRMTVAVEPRHHPHHG